MIPFVLDREYNTWYNKLLNSKNNMNKNNKLSYNLAITDTLIELENIKIAALRSEVKMPMAREISLAVIDLVIKRINLLIKETK